MTLFAIKSDSELQSDVANELKWDTRVKHTDVGVSVKDAAVTLTGTVASWAERLAAQEAAHRVAGVLDVANDIQVKIPDSSERSDTDIARAVRNALEWNVLVPDRQIQSTVSDGVVTLEGSVEHWSEHDDAARAVRNLAGVREIRNLIKVVPAQIAPQVLHQAIADALERHARHAAKHIGVNVVDGNVHLSGTVPSYPEWEAVVGAAKGTPGVRSITNDLLIRPAS